MKTTPSHPARAPGSPCRAPYVFMALISLGACAFAWWIARQQTQWRVDMGQMAKMLEKSELQAARAATPVAPCAMIGPSTEELQAAIRQELHGLLLTCEEHPCESPAAREQPLTNSEASNAREGEALSEAESIVKGALESQRWRERDAEQVRRLRANLTPEEVNALLKTLLPAINNQEVRLETRHLGF